MTWLPSSLNLRANARPIPAEPPVIRIVRPVSFIRLLSCFSFLGKSRAFSSVMSSPSGLACNPYLWAPLPRFDSRREAPAEGQQKPRRAVNPNPSRYQSPNETGFFAQKTQPGITVRSDLEVGRAGMPVGHFEFFVANHYRRLDFFLSGKREVVDRAQPFRFAVLKHKIQPTQETANRPLSSKAVRHLLRFLVREVAGHKALSVGTGNDIDSLGLALERLHYIFEKLLAVGQKRTDYILASGANRQTVRRL